MTLAPLTLDALTLLREGWDLEVKEAQGRDGRGQLPSAFWESYSAMANTEGGTILLGVRENKDRAFEVVGLKDPERVERELWATLDNRKKVSANVLHRDDVALETLDGKTVLRVEVPRASRQQRPVFLNDDLFGGTFLRVHEGDHHADRERVRRMVADAAIEARDSAALPNYDVADLDPESIRRFRARFAQHRPDHPWTALDDLTFLTNVGVRARNRETGQEGITLAGLLMLGQMTAIRDHIPQFFLDYQERRTADDLDWIDRVIPDGRWSGNLFDFYRLVIPKLHATLKVPFMLGPDMFRKEETHAHEAVREALVNTLIHADYSGRTPIQVIQYPGGFRFRNPGTLRLPPEQIRQGGTSDCRNATLQQLFLSVGLGEKAGSGFSRILRAWREQHWVAPGLTENTEIETTTLDLVTVSLLPEAAIAALDRQFGARFRAMDEAGRVALVTAWGEGRVSNHRMREATGGHPRDITLMLGRLVREGFLESHGHGTGAWYTQVQSADSGSCPGSSLSYPESGSSSGGSPTIFPISSAALLDRVARSTWARRMDVQAAILYVCRDEFHTLPELSARLNRAVYTLREHVGVLQKANRLELRYPESATHPEQGYKAVNADGTPR